MEEEHFKNLVPAFALLSWVSFTDAAHTHTHENGAGKNAKLVIHKNQLEVDL